MIKTILCDFFHRQLSPEIISGLLILLTLGQSKFCFDWTDALLDNINLILKAAILTMLQ